MCVSCQVSSHGHESRIPVERIENIILPSCVAVHCAVGAAHGAMLRAPCWFMFGLETLLLRTALIAVHSSLFSSSDRKGAQRWQSRFKTIRAIRNTYKQLLLPTAVAVESTPSVLITQCSAPPPHHHHRHSLGNSWAEGRVTVCCSDQSGERSSHLTLILSERHYYGFLLK